MQAYKYVDLEHAESVASGSLRIGTLASYADLEGSRADPWDGCLVRTAEAGHILDTDVPADRELAAQFGFNVTGSGRATFENINFFLGFASIFCFCMSDRPKNAHLMKGRPQAVYEVPDCAALADAVLRQHAWLMTEAKVGCVVYERRHIPLREGLGPVPDPFIKDTKIRTGT